jgi:hypothetical protein
MAKVTLSRLTRGIRLLPGHVFDALSDMMTEFTGTTFESEQVRDRWGTVKVNFHLPHLGSAYFDGLNTEDPFVIPLPLLPLQEDFATAVGNDAQRRPRPAPGAPPLIIDELWVSFDQRGEACAISDHRYVAVGAPHSGEFAYDLTPYDMTVSMLEKTPTVFGGGRRFERSVASLAIPKGANAARGLRLNPFGLTDIGHVVDQYKTYGLAIQAPGLSEGTGVGENYAFVSMVLTVVLRSPLFARDTTSAQNIPTRHRGLKTAPTGAISVPAAGTVIEADTGDGVSKQAALIDDFFRRGLRGGYEEHGEAPIAEELQHDAVYDVQAIPLFANREDNGTRSDNIGNQPHIGASPVVDRDMDIRTFPLRGVKSIHQVVLAYSWNPWKSNGSLAWYKSTTIDLKFELCVGIGDCFRADAANYQEFAKLEAIHTAAGWGSFAPAAGAGGTLLYDQIQSAEQSPGPPVTNLSHWDLFHVPIVGAATALSGPAQQDSPVWLGKGWTPTGARTDVAAASPPVTEGRDLLLEVRMGYYDNSGAGLDVAPAGGAVTGEIYVGYGGHWLFLIGKKHLE